MGKDGTRHIAVARKVTNPILSVLCASRMYSCRFVPIRDRQKMAMSAESLSTGKCAISHAVTRSFCDTKSNEEI